MPQPDVDFHWIGPPEDAVPAVASQIVTEPPFRLTIEVPSWSRLGKALLDVGAVGAFIYAVTAGAWELWRDR